MPLKQTIMAVVIGAAILLFIVELVRRRKLLEEYSILWIFTGIILLVFASRPDLLRLIARLLDIKIPPLVLLLFGIIFLILVCLQFSVKLTEHTHKLKNIAQELALLKHKIMSQDKKEGN